MPSNYIQSFIEWAHRKSGGSSKRIEDLSTQVTIKPLMRGLGHEIQNAIGVVISGIDLIQELPDSTEAQRYYPILKKTLLRLSQVANLLIHHGSRASHEKHLVYLDQLVQDCILLTAGECKKRKIKIISILEAPTSFYGDENSLFFSLLCILQSRFEFLTERGEIQIISSQTDSESKLILSDNGKSHPNNIDQTASLFLVKEVVELHSVYMEITSSGNEGTTVGLLRNANNPIRLRIEAAESFILK